MSKTKQQMAAAKAKELLNGDAPLFGRYPNATWLRGEQALFQMWDAGYDAAFASEAVLKLVFAVKELERCWDISNPSYIVPRHHTGEMAPNDSLAAGAIMQCVWALAAFEKHRKQESGE